MNKKYYQEEERGQSLVLVALAIVGLIAFAGLALDGGLAYAKRRIAQNAADSGAIAGTYELHRQKWDEQVNAGLLDQDRILSEIHQVVESHDVPDTDGIAGNEVNENVRAFYVSRGSTENTCSSSNDTDLTPLCDVPCNASYVLDRAVGISIEVDMPFDPIFAGFMGWDEIEVSNRANDFDQRTAAVVTAGDTGYNRDLWAIFAMNNGSTTGPSTFIEVDPVFQPPVGFAFANVHAQGSFSVGNHPPIMGQVTYCDDCENCFNAILDPEQRQYQINLPNFDEFRDLAQELANSNSWPGGFMIPSGIYFIDGDLDLDAGNIAVGQYIFIYATGNVRIDGFFYAQNLTIMSEGPIAVNGTLKTVAPYSDIDNSFVGNDGSLWSNYQGENAINITGQLVTSASPFFNDSDIDIGGSVIAFNSTVNVDSVAVNTTIRGSVIGNVVWVNSSAETGNQTRIQYNGNYFPIQPDRIELLK
jgi:hypothetical protein